MRSLSTSCVSHDDDTKRILNHSQSQSIHQQQKQQQQQRSTRPKTKALQSAVPNVPSLVNQNVGYAHGSSVQNDVSNQNILKLIDKQSEIATLLVKQHILSSLPPREIPYFDGDPLRFHEFMRSFEEVVEKRADSPGDCLHFLEQYTRGQPKELVKSCQHMTPAQGYLRAKTLLKENFGNEVKIALSYMEKALGRL